MQICNFAIFDTLTGALQNFGMWFLRILIIAKKSLQFLGDNTPWIFAIFVTHL
jgi:hypothetical protein